jgi:hypothetical protein
MSKLKNLLEELRAVTERSQPNTMYNDQIYLINEIENELNKSDIPCETSNEDSKRIKEIEPIDYTSQGNDTKVEMENTPKKGRKPIVK